MNNLPHIKPINRYRPYWASRFGTARFLPMSKQEMDDLGWDSCDIILVTGDAYIDHPSFGMALIGRVLEAQGFRVGIISQPDWKSAADFRCLGRPNLFFGVTAGNMDSMVNHYTSERKIRSDDAYTPDGVAGKRPDRAVIVYAQRCQEAFPGAPVVIGSIEASLRRIAHYDYWSDQVRRSVLFDSKADLLLYGNAERAIVELAHRLSAAKEPDKAIAEIRDLRGTAFAVSHGWTPDSDWQSIDFSFGSKLALTPTETTKNINTPYDSSCVKEEAAKHEHPVHFAETTQKKKERLEQRARQVIRLPSYEMVKKEAAYYAHASRTLHLESNPGNARCLVQAHGTGQSLRDIWLNPPPIPLDTKEMDWVYDLPYARAPHPSYLGKKIPAWEMIRHSVNIMRGCFGGCTFCSITEHEGRIIQSRSEQSILKEIEAIRDTTSGFTGVISDLGGPTANMWRLACKDEKIESSCRRLSCVYPAICKHLDTNHQPLIELYRKARNLPGIKKVLISSGLRYDLAVRSPEYVQELVTHHVGGYLKIAPEHSEEGPLSKMMKPGMDSYERFRQLFERFSKACGKEQYLIPYFIAAHPGTEDQDMLNLALWLKQNRFRLDQVQTFLPTPMALATAMYYSNKNPLKKFNSQSLNHRSKEDVSEQVHVIKNARQRRIHKAFLRYHDPHNWPVLRAELIRMGRRDLIGYGKKHLIPTNQPANFKPSNKSGVKLQSVRRNRQHSQR